MDRNLDGYYFRVERDGRFVNKSFSDLTEDEMVECIQRFDREALMRFCIGLGKAIREIGDALGLYGEAHT